MSAKSAKIVKWLVALLVLVLLALGVLRALSSRKAQTEQLATAASAKAGSLVELAGTDVVKAGLLDIVQGLPVSGSLKAVNSAVVKARVAGELQGLVVREGDFVKAGQLIARIDATEYRSRVRQAQNQADAAKSQLEVAQRQYDNNKALVDQGFISKTSLDTSLSNLNAAQANYRAAVAATDITSKSVDDTLLRAPISGQVSQRLAQPGERVGVDARVIEIVDVSRLELEATLSAADSVMVQVGQTAELQIEGSSQSISAKVVRINPSAQAGSRSVLAYLSLPGTDSNSNATSSNAQGALTLRQGLFAQGTLGTTRATLLAIPVSSVRTDKPAPYVQTVEKGQIVHRPVETGARGSSGNEAVVAVKGLTEGDTVVRGNIGMLREGTQVRFTAGLPAAAVEAAAAAASAAAAQATSGKTTTP